VDPAAVETLGRYRDGETTLLVRLSGILLRDTPPRLEELHGALARADADAVGRVAHTLRGSAANFGARRFSRLAGELEEIAEDLALPGAGPAMELLEAEWARLKEALEALGARP